MKKLLNRLLVWMLVCCAALLVGCSKDWTGTYKFKSIRYEDSGMTVEVEAGEELMGMITLTEDFVVLTLNDDGTAIMTTKLWEETKQEGTWKKDENCRLALTEETRQEGTWKKDENGKLALTFEDSTETVECDGKTILFEMGGVSMVLEK